jgi:hypothetical protein
MDWSFGNSELSNLFDDAIIKLPNGEEIKNSKNSTDTESPTIDCMLICKEENQGDT